MVGDPKTMIDEQVKPGLLDEEQVEELAPAPNDIVLPLSECLTDLVYVEDGQPAPDVEVHFSINFKMGNLADYNTLLEHPHSDEIANTISSYIHEHGYEAMLGELQDNDFNTLRPDTMHALNQALSELVPMLNATYGLNIVEATVNHSSEEVDGCSPSPWALPKDQASIQRDIKIEPDYAEGAAPYKPL